MMTIEEEIDHLVKFLQHPAGFDVDMAGQLCIRPVYETTQHWEVDWEEIEGTINLKFYKLFGDLKEAATFFVEKRHYLCLGLDFNEIAMKEFLDNE